MPDWWFGIRSHALRQFPLADGHLAHLHPNLRALSVSSIVLKEVDMLGLQVRHPPFAVAVCCGGVLWRCAVSVWSDGLLPCT